MQCCSTVGSSMGGLGSAVVKVSSDSFPDLQLFVQVVLQSSPATLSAWPRLFAKQAGQGEGSQADSAAEASSSSGDEAGTADAQAAGAAEGSMDVAELQELLAKAQEEVGANRGCRFCSSVCSGAGQVATNATLGVVTESFWLLSGRCCTPGMRV